MTPDSTLRPLAFRVLSSAALVVLMVTVVYQLPDSSTWAVVPTVTLPVATPRLVARPLAVASATVLAVT
ncbi:hypothetical protein D3C78_1970840 [compost metagenome]